ncbi:MAG: sigma-E processing peptidase SpoIIGA [Ruminococcus sp.]|nr:sigma-E processing peptidase SpoIIGA [Ruminococcus sp.]
METIYLDVLIILNIYMNFFLLRITACITHSPLKNARCAAASLYGSLFSLLILVPELNGLLSALIRAFAAFTISAAAFGFHGRKRLVTVTGAFLGANFILAGCIYAVYSWLTPDFMHFNNSYFYIDFSLLVLVITTSALYAAAYAARILLDKAPPGHGCYRITVKYRGKTASLEGLADTGNSLVDMFSGSPVIVCGADDLAGILPEGGSTPARGFRLIPCRTVTASGVMPVFRPDEVLILDMLSGVRKPVDAVIGLGKTSGSAVFNPGLLRL